MVCARVRQSLRFPLVGALWTLWILSSAGASAAETGWATPPDGHTRSIAAQRTLTPPIIDGAVDDSAWKDAPAADAFWVSPWQRPPTDDTIVHVLYDDETLYFAFICFDARPDLIRARQMTRDAGPGLDDRVTIVLDPHHNHRSLSRFTVTARGTQSDVMAGGRARQIAWKGAWSGAARRTPEGWTAEIAIPLAVLEFDPAASLFGINFERYQHRTREWSEWATLTPQRLPEEAGHLTGLRLRGGSTSGRLAFMQYVSGNTIAADVLDPRAFGTGVDVRYQWRGGLTSMVSVLPDFGAIDADVPGVGFSYNEKYVSDHRPFFQEGAAFFGDRSVFHSGRIEDFDVGVKTFGRHADYQVGMLTTRGPGGRSDYVGRVVREVGPTLNLSATLAGTERETFGSHLLQVAAGGRLGRHLRVSGDVARSATDGAPGDGIRGHGSLMYEATHWYSGGWIDSTTTDYVPADGFIAGDVPGTTGRGAFAGYHRAFGEGWMRQTEASASFDVRETVDGRPQRQMASLYAGTDTALNVLVNAGITAGSYRPRGSEPGRWMDVVNDDRVYLASAYYQSPGGQFGYGAQYSWGFVGAAEYDSLAPSIWLAPVSRVSFAYSLDRANHDQVRTQHVVSGTWEIDGGQALSARWVDADGGHYRVSYRRMLAHGIDAYSVYTANPYDPGTLNVKLVWTLLPFRGRR